MTERERLLEGLRPHAFAIAYRMLGSVAEAEDVVQDALLRVHRALEAGEQIGSPREIYYRPANRTVAQFVGTINRLAGERRDGMLTTTGGAVPLPAGSTHASPAHEIFCRPEDAYLAYPAHAQLRGHIESTAFLGERTRLTVGGAAPDALLIDVAGRVELARGTPVGISIAQDALIALS